MKSLILIKSGALVPNLFSSLGDDFNNPLPPPPQNTDPFHVPPPVDSDMVSFSFFNKVPFTYQLVGNVLSDHPSTALAISHHINHVFSPAPDPNLFHPLNLEQLMGYADIFDSVIYGVVQTTEVITASNTLSHARAFARNPTTGDIIDLELNSAVDPSPGHSAVYIVSLFGILKIKHLPIYCIITDPRILTVGVGVDTESDHLVTRSLTDWDDSFRNAVMCPRFSNNVEVLNGNTLFVTGDTFTIDLFDGPLNLFELYGVSLSDDIPIYTKSNLPTTTTGNHIVVTFPVGVHAGFIHIKIPGGPFFENRINPDTLILTYTLIR